jgi:hypothetical protein
MLTVSTTSCPSLIAHATSTDLTCFQDNSGQIFITIDINNPGSGAPYTYSIDNGVNYVSNGGTFGGLSAGSYKIRVQDKAGCESKSVQ